jgi:NADH-quinone oxidoreductase subunit L
VIRPLELLASFLHRVVDQGIIDGAVNGTASLVDLSGEISRGTQTGQVRHYALFMFIATLLILFFFVFSGRMV